MDEGMSTFEQMMEGNFEGAEEMFKRMIPPFTDHVKQQRRRLGGDWAVAWAIFSREHRERARELLGEDLVFIVLNMTKECQRRRLDERHAGTGVKVDIMEQMFKLYEPAGEDEMNAFNVTISEDMSPHDVVEEVLKILRNLK